MNIEPTNPRRPAADQPPADRPAVNPSHRQLKRLAEVALVILLLVAGTAILMPTLSSTRKLSQKAASAIRAWDDDAEAQLAKSALADKPAVRGEVRSFEADIDLTSRVSIGTAKPESIYEAKFRANIEARNPGAAAGNAEIRLPLPPQLISLSDLNVTVNGDPSENVFLDDGVLVWRGRLDVGEPVPLAISYTAVGKGLYELRVPPGKIVDVFDVTLTANRADLRMMELSLQPAPPERDGGKTVYRWHYERLMLGRPIRIDILGLAPMDRLADLVWLGPISVLAFGLLVAMVSLAFRPEALDKWMLLLIVGAFAAAYPLMYHAQDFVSLPTAIVAACVAMMAIIGARAVTLLGVRVGVLGVVLTGGAALTVATMATVFPQTQGMLLTALVVGALVAMMSLLPRVQKTVAASAAPPPIPPGAPETE